MMRLTVVLVLSLATVTGLGWFLFGSDLPVVMDTAIARTRNDVKDTLGSEFRLDQASQQLGRADEEILDQEARVAELRVSCQDLKEEVGTLSQAVNKAERDFVALDAAWQRSGEGTRAVSYRSRMTDPAVIDETLQRTALRATSFKRRLETRQQVLANHAQALEKADRMLREIRTRREKVALTIENSRIDLESVRLLQASTGTDVRASALANAEQFARDLSKDLRVQREVITVHGEVDSGFTLADSDPTETVDQLRAELGLTRDIEPRNEVAAKAGERSGFSY
ncbi:hypothetical protein OAG62_00505 [bacterium]|nr:hypothetical protein [bacterium]